MATMDCCRGQVPRSQRRVTRGVSGTSSGRCLVHLLDYAWCFARRGPLIHAPRCPS